MDGCHLSDARIWQLIQALQHEKGWTAPALLIDAITEREGVDRDRVARVYRERTIMHGAG